MLALHSPPAPVRLRAAGIGDLAALNSVVERAFMTWTLPERVKRLSLPSYRYRAIDLDFLRIVVAERAQHIVGVAAWEAADARDLPIGLAGLLLHGLYVDPASLRQGIGSQLLDAAVDAARVQGCDGVLVKAQADAVGFFVAYGMRLLPVHDPERDYPHRYWFAVDTPPVAASAPAAPQTGTR